MKTRTFLAWPVVCALTVASCSSAPDTPLSPSGAVTTSSFVNADGSTLKVTKPGGLSPNGGVLDTRRPTLTFTASTGLYPSSGTPLSGATYDVEVQDAAGGVIYARTLTGTSHTIDTDAPYSTTFWWRARARIGDLVGPWADFAMFRTEDEPRPSTPGPPVPQPGGALPFPVPAACGPGDPSNRFACAAAVAALSVEWQACAGGRGVSCHRFTRQVVYALAQSDPNWKLILAAPGGHACNCFGCGPSDGTYFREDTTVYGGNRVFDMIVGAGGPSPSLTWSAVPGPRPGDLPTDAPLCVP